MDNTSTSPPNQFSPSVSTRCKDCVEIIAGVHRVQRQQRSTGAGGNFCRGSRKRPTRLECTDEGDLREGLSRSRNSSVWNDRHQQNTQGNSR
ncbi:hypothetical protein ANCCAN_20798 [Ancylostoma caninum]|uniref:Uncharacterized protein n=1 Tax=Ancylostoma caninum TaxID=29170 RepID=A0A368FMG1_ANCCA|nr:hypothetical protein ANCCAN_20798 [Ancylostoma caninum]